MLSRWQKSSLNAFHCFNDGSKSETLRWLISSFGCTQKMFFVLYQTQWLFNGAVNSLASIFLILYERNTVLKNETKFYEECEAQKWFHFMKFIRIQCMKKRNNGIKLKLENWRREKRKNSKMSLVAPRIWSDTNLRVIWTEKIVLIAIESTWKINFTTLESYRTVCYMLCIGSVHFGIYKRRSKFIYSKSTILRT